MFFFAFGIDPLITYLEKRLSGILIASLPQHGPVEMDSVSEHLPNIEERYTVVSYADDLKPAVTSLEELALVDKGSALFESASWLPATQKPLQ